MYKTLADIQAEKERLNNAIKEKENEISVLWGEIFYSKENPATLTPSQRILQFAHTGAGIFDGLLFGWKLYRKFSGGKSSLFSRKKHR